MFGMDVLIEPQIGPIVLDFPIFAALGNDGAQSVDFGFANRRQLGIFAPQIFRQHIQEINYVRTYRVVWHRDVEKSVDGKKEKITRRKYNSLSLSRSTVITLDCGPMSNVITAQPNIGGASPKVP